MDRSDISKNLDESNNQEAPARIAITVTYKVVIVSVSYFFV